MVFHITWKGTDDFAYLNAQVGLQQSYVLKNKGLERVSEFTPRYLGHTTPFINQQMLKVGMLKRTCDHAVTQDSAQYNPVTHLLLLYCNQNTLHPDTRHYCFKPSDIFMFITSLSVSSSGCVPLFLRDVSALESGQVAGLGLQPLERILTAPSLSQQFWGISGDTCRLAARRS